MEQRCYLWSIWLAWIGMPLLAVVVWLRMGLAAALLVLAVGIIGQMLYIRWFPRLSRALGYGSVADEPAGRLAPARALPSVTLYTASVCPFCPIVKRRLADLQRDLHFELREIDVTFRPDVIRGKGLRSVPVIEMDGRFLAGNATSQQLAAFLTNTGAPT